MTESTAARISDLGTDTLLKRITTLAQSEGNGRTAPPHNCMQKLGIHVLIPKAAIIK